MALVAEIDEQEAFFLIEIRSAREAFMAALNTALSSLGKKRQLLATPARAVRTRARVTHWLGEIS